MLLMRFYNFIASFCGFPRIVDEKNLSFAKMLIHFKIFVILIFSFSVVTNKRFTGVDLLAYNTSSIQKCLYLYAEDTKQD